MKKTAIYILVALILGVGAWYMLKKDNTIYPESETGFNFPDTNGIYEILLSKRNGNYVHIKRNGDAWILNDSFEARAASVSQLLGVLYKQKAVFPVPKEQHNDIIKSLAGHSITVEIIDRDGNQMKRFFVGGQMNTTEGSFMLVDGAQRPYVVQVPNFNGYLTPYYEPDFKSWRGRSVFNIPSADIKSVSVEYDDKPINSFTIENGEPPVVHIDPRLNFASPFNKRRAEAYLRYFTGIYSEAFVNGQPYETDQFAYAKKRATVTVTPKKGQPKQIVIYWMAINKRSMNMSQHVDGVPDGYDADRYYAVIPSTKDSLLVQDLTFRKILRKGYEFYQEDEAPQPREKPIEIPLIK